MIFLVSLVTMEIETAIRVKSILLVSELAYVSDVTHRGRLDNGERKPLF